MTGVCPPCYLLKDEEPDKAMLSQASPTRPRRGRQKSFTAPLRNKLSGKQEASKSPATLTRGEKPPETPSRN